MNRPFYQRRPAGQPKRHNSRGEWYEGHFFRSQKELRRWKELNLLLADGQIKNLQREVPYKIGVDGELMFTYRLDFQYFDRKLGHIVHEDVKGYAGDTPYYRLKKKFVEAVHHIRILEV